MNDRYVVLQGTELVQAAANTMSSAARDIRDAAFSMADELQRHRQFLEDLAQRFVQSMPQPTPTPAEPGDGYTYKGIFNDLIAMLLKIDALKAAYPPPAERGEYAAQTALFDLYQFADAIERNRQR